MLGIAEDDNTSAATEIDLPSALEDDIVCDPILTQQALDDNEARGVEVSNAGDNDEVAVYAISPEPEGDGDDENLGSDDAYIGPAVDPVAPLDIPEARPSRVRQPPKRFRDKDMWWNHADAPDSDFD